MTSPLFSRQFSYAPTYPVGLQTGIPQIGVTLPTLGEDVDEDESPSGKPTDKPEDTPEVPSPTVSPSVGPVATGAEEGVSAPNRTPTSFSGYFDQTAVSPKTINPSTLGPNSGSAAVSSPSPSGGGFGGFLHDVAHTFDSIRHGAANAADKFGGTAVQQAGMPNQYSPRINNTDSGFTSFMNAPNYSAGGVQAGVSVPRGLNAAGGFSSRSAPLSPQQFIDQPGTYNEEVPSISAVPGIGAYNENDDPDAVWTRGYDYSKYDLEDLPMPNAADRVSGIPSPVNPAIEAPKMNYSQYLTQQGDYQNVNLNPTQFGSAASDASSAGSDGGGSWFGTFLRDFSEDDG